jgi:hypothetical protein
MPHQNETGATNGTDGTICFSSFNIRPWSLVRCSWLPVGGKLKAVAECDSKLVGDLTSAFLPGPGKRRLRGSLLNFANFGPLGIARQNRGKTAAADTEVRCEDQGFRDHALRNLEGRRGLA